MLMLVVGLYILCAVGFYIQAYRHAQCYFAEEPTAPMETAEIIELFPSAPISERAA